MRKVWAAVTKSQFLRGWRRLVESTSDFEELQKMMLHIDAIKPTAVSVERVNKANGRLVPKERSRPKVATVRKTLRFHCNLRLINSTQCASKSV